MNLLNAENISKTYGDKTIFDNITLGVHDGDKIGIIGINGTGKSSLLKIIAGYESPDEGQVVRGNKVYIEYLPQTPEFKKDDTVLHYVLSARPADEQWLVEGDAKSMLHQLGIEDFTVNVHALSGGQRKRVALARTLLTPSDILVLDEPTNHLDNEMSDWLENYLRKYRGAIIMVTHDRYFLDAVVNRIVEIDNAALYEYEGNYSKYLEMRALRLDMARASDRKRQAILKNELAWIARGARARSTKQQARIDRLDDLKVSVAPKEDGAVDIGSLSSRLGKKTIEAVELTKAYGDKVLFDHFSYTFLKDDRIGIVGRNGAGKTTLLKTIVGLVTPDGGHVDMGPTIKIGYFSQENEYLDDSVRVIDCIRDVAEYIQTTEGRTSASQMLERFLFTPEMQWTPVSKLSGGEKRRLYLLRILMDAPNVLILDEPTNDLDIQTLTILEDYLDSFAGIVITVSHDRYFLDRVVRRIFAFEGGGVVRQYEGGFTDYHNALLRRQAEDDGTGDGGVKTSGAGRTGAGSTANPGSGTAGTGSDAGTPAFNGQRHQQRLKFTFKEQQEYNTIDADIEKLEQALQTAEENIAASARDYVKLNQYMEEKEALQNQLDEKMERWVYLNDLAEKIEAAQSSRN